MNGIEVRVAGVEGGRGDGVQGVAGVVDEVEVMREVEGEAGEQEESVTGWVDLPVGTWHDLLSDTDHPGGPTPAAHLLATLPHALLIRA